MRNDDKVLARLWKLWAMICKMIMDGKRDPDVVVDALQAVVDNVPKWWQNDEEVHFILPPTDGTTGKRWIERLNERGYCADEVARGVLESPDFKPTIGIVREILVLKGKVFRHGDCNPEGMKRIADERGLKYDQALEMNPEVACQIREMFSDEELKKMGFENIMVVHKPIKSYDHDPYRLHASRICDGGRWLSGCYESRPILQDSAGAAFVVSAKQIPK